jgi:hypothetical protein
MLCRAADGASSMVLARVCLLHVLMQVCVCPDRWGFCGWSFLNPNHEVGDVGMRPRRIHAADGLRILNAFCIHRHALGAVSALAIDAALFLAPTSVWSSGVACFLDWAAHTPSPCTAVVGPISPALLMCAMRLWLSCLCWQLNVVENMEEDAR